MSGYDHKIETSLEGIENLSKEYQNLEEKWLIVKNSEYISGIHYLLK